MNLLVGTVGIVWESVVIGTVIVGTVGTVGGWSVVVDGISVVVSPKICWILI